MHGGPLYRSLRRSLAAVLRSLHTPSPQHLKSSQPQPRRVPFNNPLPNTSIPFSTQSFSRGQKKAVRIEQLQIPFISLEIFECLRLWRFWPAPLPCWANLLGANLFVIRVTTVCTDPAILLDRDSRKCGTPLQGRSRPFWKTDFNMPRLDPQSESHSAGNLERQKMEKLRCRKLGIKRRCRPFRRVTASFHYQPPKHLGARGFLRVVSAARVCSHVIVQSPPPRNYDCFLQSREPNTWS